MNGPRAVLGSQRVRTHRQAELIRTPQYWGGRCEPRTCLRIRQSLRRKPPSGSFSFCVLCVFCGRFSLFRLDCKRSLRYVSLRCMPLFMGADRWSFRRRREKRLASNRATWSPSSHKERAGSCSFGSNGRRFPRQEPKSATERALTRLARPAGKSVAKRCARCWRTSHEA